MTLTAVLACDLGSTSLRVATVDAQGAVATLARREHAVAEEADPERWWALFADAAAEVLRGAPPVAGIALTAFTRTQVFADAQGAPTRAALTWRDARAASDEDADGDDPAARPGPFDPLTRIAWVRAHDKAAFARTALVLEPKDWLNLRLTGRAATDAVTLGRLDYPPLGRDLGARLARLGLDRALFGEIVTPTATVGRVQALPPPFDALEGRPVFAGGQDTWTATLGMGAARPGHAYIVSGTTEVAGAILDSPRRAAGLMCLPWGDHLHHVGGPSQGGLDALAWAADLAGLGGVDGAIAAAEAASGPPLLFHPYLQGERVPLWDARLRGALLGLDRRHGAGDLARAVVEGIAFCNRRVLEAACARTESVRIAGGGARFDLWCQAKADVLGVPVERCAADEPGLLGAAIVAWTGLGRFASLAAAQALAGVRDRFLPHPARVAALDARYRAFLAADRAVAAASHAIR